MMKRTKVTVAAAGAVLALVGGGTGVAFAQTSDPAPSPTPSPSGSPAPHGARHWHGGRGGFGHGGFGDGGLLGRIEHGEATVDTGTNNATQVIDIQRGTVDSVDSAGSETLTVHSADGFSATYTIDNSTKIRKDREASDISQVAANDRVTVVAIKAGDTLTAQRIDDIGPAQ